MKLINFHFQTGCALLWAALNDFTPFLKTTTTGGNYAVFVLLAISFFNFAGYLFNQPAFYVAVRFVVCQLSNYAL